MHDRIWLSPPHMGGEEKNFVEEAFEGNWLAPVGPNIDGFEQDLSNYLEDTGVTALASGTAAIHLALRCLGVEREDIVLASSFTFCASANPITYVGAKPVFIDSEEDTWNLSPELLEHAIKALQKQGKRPKALILVHLYGMPANLESILSICRHYEIPIIEDAAEALGSRFKDRKLGTFGDIGILSFNGNKIITTSGGGALISRDPKTIELAKSLATQAREPAPHYQHEKIGYNYRMSNVVAGIGRGQMKVIEQRVAQKRKINSWYRELFKNIEGISFQTEPAESFFSNYWLTCMTVNASKSGFSATQLADKFGEENIESRPLWKPMHLQPVFKDALHFTDGCAEKLFQNGICLPSGTVMQENELGRIASVIQRIIN